MNLLNVDARTKGTNFEQLQLAILVRDNLRYMVPRKKLLAENTHPGTWRLRVWSLKDEAQRKPSQDIDDKVGGRMFETLVVSGAFCLLGRELESEKLSKGMDTLLFGMGSNATGSMPTE